MTRRDSALMPSSRRRTASANVAGTPGALRSAACQRPSRSVSAPSPTSPARTSSTRNGMPSARPATNSCTAAGRSAASRQARAMSAIAVGPRRPSASMAADPRAASALASAAASPPSSYPASLRVARHSTRSAARLSARYSSSASVSWSAQCRSSRTSTQPACGARARSRRSTASPRKTGVSSPGTGCGGRHSGISRPSTGRNGPSSSLGRQAPRSPGRGQRLGERPERRGRAAGHGPAGQDRQAALARRARDLPDQSRFTDASLSGQEHRAAATRPGRRQGGPQPAGFLVPPDQDRAQHLRHRISIGPETGTGL